MTLDFEDCRARFLLFFGFLLRGHCSFVVCKLVNLAFEAGDNLIAKQPSHETERIWCLNKSNPNPAAGCDL